MRASRIPTSQQMLRSSMIWSQMKKSPRDPEAVIQTAEDLLRRADSEGRRFLFEHEVYGILQEMGIRPPIHHLVAASADVTPELLSRFPSSRIVLKAVSVPASRTSRGRAASRRC